MLGVFVYDKVTRLLHQVRRSACQATIHSKVFLSTVNFGFGINCEARTFQPFPIFLGGEILNPMLANPHHPISVWTKNSRFFH